MEKKLFTCTDSTIDEVQKVINEVTTEIGFHCIPTILKVREEGGSYLKGGLV